ncbi:hypothetical protein N0V95_001185 [Ascochyta clinopodiicola]|nr:hypothetical protein N0V95_001185 [Ascochyta clinopodiicola]
MHQPLQRENVDLARKNLVKANKAHNAMRKDHEAQFAAFRESRHQHSTDIKLTNAYFEWHRTAKDDEYLHNLANKWYEHLRTERTEVDNEDFFTGRFGSPQLSHMYGLVRGGLGYYRSSPPISAAPEVETDEGF